MPETQIANPAEVHIAPDQKVAADQVFDGVYQKFAESARAASDVRTDCTDGEVREYRVDRATEFVTKRFEKAKRQIGAIDATRIGPDIIKDRYLGDAKRKAEADYASRPKSIAARLERVDRVVSKFLDRANEMHETGEADGLTSKVCFVLMREIKFKWNTGYRDLVNKTDEPLPERIPGGSAYSHLVGRIATEHGDVISQKDASFLHINGERYQKSGEKIVDRYYISPKRSGKPEEVLKVWMETLKDLGLDERLYYKVHEEVSRRYDQVVVFVSSEMTERAEAAIQEFSRRCPPELLSDTTLPSGVEVARGVARAPDPIELKTLLKYRGRRSISYNEFASALTELSLQRASYDFIQQDVKPGKVKPRKLAEAAKPYFTQFVKLSGIDPVTMRVIPTAA